MKNPDWNETKKMLLRDSKSPLSHLFLGSDIYKEDQYKEMSESDDWTLEMLVNGVKSDPIKLDEFLKRLWEVNYNSMIKEEAEKLMNEKWSECFGGIEEFVEKANDILRDKLQYSWESNNAHGNL